MTDKVQISFENSKFKHLRCDYKKDELHLFEDPKKLDCGRTLCKDCVKELVIYKTKCTCNNKHNITNIDALPDNEEVIKELETNANEIAEDMMNIYLGCTNIEDKSAEGIL